MSCAANAKSYREAVCSECSSPKAVEEAWKCDRFVAVGTQTGMEGIVDETMALQKKCLKLG